VCVRASSIAPSSYGLYYEPARATNRSREDHRIEARATRQTAYVVALSVRGLNEGVACALQDAAGTLTTRSATLEGTIAGAVAPGAIFAVMTGAGNSGPEPSLERVGGAGQLKNAPVSWTGGFAKMEHRC
jgi:hypothetical protein